MKLQKKNDMYAATLKTMDEHIVFFIKDILKKTSSGSYEIGEIPVW